MPTPRFQPSEIVRVATGNPDLAEIHGERGVIPGITDGDGLAREYGVFIYRDEICWQLAEHELEPTG